jgi:hypothetical protein
LAVIRTSRRKRAELSESTPSGLHGDGARLPDVAGEIHGRHSSSTEHPLYLVSLGEDEVRRQLAP